MLKPTTKKTGKVDRKRKVLLGLVEHFLNTGKPVGSHTLQEFGFGDLSSATIRNYLAHLEEEGYLIQQHASGGRIPTDKAFRLYAQTCLDETPIAKHDILSFDSLRSIETREIAAFLQNAAEQLAKASQTAVFLSAPHFEQDFIIGIKLVAIDASRCLCVLITDFGEIYPELIHPPHKLSAFTMKRLEAYFNWRLNGRDKPDHLSQEEEELAAKLYNELMVRYIVSYSQSGEDEIYRTGFSTLLNYPEFHDPSLLAGSLSLFENTHGMRLILKECSKLKALKFWIGNDLIAYSPQSAPHCSILAMPYFVNKQTVGAIGLLGPLRIPYRQLMTTLRDFTDNISEALTRNLYKFKISMRQPKQETIDLKRHELHLIGPSRHLLLEDKRGAHLEKRAVHHHPSRRKGHDTKQT